MPLSQAEATLLQRCLNVALDRNPPLRTDGGIGDRSKAAIRDFQRLVKAEETGEATPELLSAALAFAQAQGWKPRVAPGGTPRWLGIAAAEDGVAELPGTASNNPRILGYLATMPGLPPEDETPWCACFVTWCLLRAGVEVPTAGGPTAAALSWAGFGTELPPASAPPGAIAVLFNRNKPAATTASGFHVGFLVELQPKGVVLRGGNQGNRVSQSLFASPAWELKALRWPG